jgi:hypothetical protein
VWEAPSTTVTSPSDVSNPFDDQVTLREAIDYGTQLTGNRASASPRSIFTSNATTITLTQGVLTINDNTGVISIVGPSVSTGNVLTISGNDASVISRCFQMQRLAMTEQRHRGIWHLSKY